MSNFDRRDFLKALVLSACTLFLGAGVKPLAKLHGKRLFPLYREGKYQARDFSYLLKNDKLGLSPKMLEAHLALYQAYINKVNSAETKMSQNIIDDSSLKDLSFALNGMALHDIYFANLAVDKALPSRALRSALEENFASFDNYLKNLCEIAMKVKGWSLTCVNLLNGKIFNYGQDTHSSNFPIYSMPILALDVYDHAFVMDFGENGKDRYIKLFTQIIDWDLVSQRYDEVA